MDIDKYKIFDKNSLIFYLGNGDEEVEGSVKDVFNAVDEYCELLNIEFLNFISDNNIKYASIMNRWIDRSDTLFTAKELYLHFLINTQYTNI